MQVDTFGNMIGRGEMTARQILKVWWPEGLYQYNVKLVKIIENKGYPEPLSERQKKESIDIFYSPFEKGQKIALRVQDKRHRGEGLARADRHEKDILEKCGVIVVDCHENECKELFKERVNYHSFWEVANALKMAGVKP